MHKIAGELLPTVFYVSARSLACQSLSIFGDHSDVMAARNTGFALVAASSIQEVHDMGLMAQLATLKSRIPFLVFFDGFRTSHEVQKTDLMAYDDIAKLVEPKYIEEFRDRAMRPDKPYAKVGAQNPDVYFQGREASNRFYDALPAIIKEYMEKVSKATGRKLAPFEYIGHPQAESVIIAMGSACETIEEFIGFMNAKKGTKYGAVKVRVYRPWSATDFLAALPKSVKKIAVLDRTKEPGALGEPLFLDVVASAACADYKIIGGRYGLSSKEFTPAMVKAVFDHLEGKGTHNFTVGIEDDKTHLSLKVGPAIDTGDESVNSCKFWGYGSDGTISANKNSIKIIGEQTDLFVQGYFAYDSKKSGGITCSHLRFSKKPIQSQYLLEKVDFVALHKESYIGKYDILKDIKEGGTFLLNSEWKKEEVFDHLTPDLQKIIIEKKLKFYNIDAVKIAKEVGLGGRISTVMQTAFFKLAKPVPEAQAIQLIKDSVKKTFEKKGMEIVEMNWKAIDASAAAVEEIPVPKTITKSGVLPKLIPDGSDKFTKDIILPIMRFDGDVIPVSAMPEDGVIPTNTTCLEKRGIAIDVPEWKSENCIQCAQCSLVCPHAAIRIKQIDKNDLAGAPEGFKTIKSTIKNDKELQFRVQVYIDDCTGCESCANNCPAKNKALVMHPLSEARASGESAREKFFEKLPYNVLAGQDPFTIKGSQLMLPYFEFSLACEGCGETPYVKLVSQLYGSRMIIANATGCTSIYGGTFPTIPYVKDKKGRGPAWANSLFEDNAEYGYGMRLAIDNNRALLRLNAETLLKGGLKGEIADLLKKRLDAWTDVSDAAQDDADKIKSLLKSASVDAGLKTALAKVIELSDYFVDKSVWCFGGDGWAYDIGYGGLDHVLASGQNVNILVLDTEVYSNTGGQASKATAIGARAKFAEAGKEIPKKDLALMLMSYGYVYVAQIAMGANMAQTVKAFKEAESYNGPSIIIAYAPCIAHGVDMSTPMLAMKRAVDSGHWTLLRYDPRLTAEGKNPLQMDSKETKISLADYIGKETRYKSLTAMNPERAAELLKKAEANDQRRLALLKKMAE
jgi:pyruvate-ferredoxin/flavodoxin oxidoreductase